MMTRFLYVQCILSGRFINECGFDEFDELKKPVYHLNLLTKYKNIHVVYSRLHLHVHVYFFTMVIGFKV